MNDDGDQVILKNLEGVVVDAMSYGEGALPVPSDGEALARALSGEWFLTTELTPERANVIRSPVPVGSYFFTFGNFTGKSFSGTGTIPHFSQWIIGIGSPQYL